jgi:ABC-type ATPase involved in cell division
MADNSIIEMNNVFLDSDRGDQVFRDLSFRLQAGRSAVITGSAGAGKTLFAELLIARRFVDSGSVELFGELIGRRRKKLIREIRKKIGGVGGLYNLNPGMTVSENITFPLILDSQKKKVRRERLMKMLTEFSLVKQAGRYPDVLTRVENMLALFARASIANQPLMIIDEPAAGLDQQTFERVFEYLVKVSLSGRSMVILCSETPKQQLPNTDYYHISQGGLA